MKRFLSLLLVLAVVFSMVACGAKESVAKDVNEESAPGEPVILRNYSDVWPSFEEKLKEIALFKTALQQDLDTEDGGYIHVCSIVHSAFGDNYHVSFVSNSNGDVTQASIFADRAADATSFALLSYYMYGAMSLPDMDAEEFYEKFKLLSGKDIIEIARIDGYDLMASTTGDYINFAILVPEDAVIVEQTVEVAGKAETEESTAIQTYPLNAEKAYYDFAVSPPDHIYNTLASENGLEGTIYVFDGAVEAIEIMNADGLPIEFAKVMTDIGPVMVLNMYQALYEEGVRQFGEEIAKTAFTENPNNYVLPKIGETANFLTVYWGYSNAYEMPAFCLGASANFLSILGYEDPVAVMSEIQTENKEDNGSNLVAEPEPTEAATMGEINALDTAHSYLKYSAFSYTGLIDQLEYEGYTHDEAVYGAENCGADWNQQAEKSAESYLKYSAFSYTGLIEQLEYEGFTHDEAVHGADSCAADWNEQAAKSAESYLKYSSFSKSGLIQQLQYEGFTYEQAVYGVEANGY